MRNFLRKFVCYLMLPTALSQAYATYAGAQTLRIERVDEVSYQVTLPTRSVTYLNGDTVAGTTDISCMPSGLDERAFVNLPDSVEPLVPQLTEYFGFSVPFYRKNEFLVRSMGRSSFYVMYDVLRNSDAALSKAIFDAIQREEIAVDSANLPRVLSFLETKCRYSKALNELYLILWKNTLSGQSAYDDTFLMNRSIQDSGVLGGIFVPNSPSNLNEANTIVFGRLSGTVSDYLQQVSAFRDYWTEVREREVYTWQDFLFLMEYSRSQYISRMDFRNFNHNDALDSNRYTQFFIADLNNIVDQMLSKVQPVHSALVHLADLKRQVTVLMNRFPELYSGAVEAGYTLDWQGIRETSGLNYDTYLAEKNQLTTDLSNFMNIDLAARDDARDQLSDLSIADQLDRVLAERDRTLETYNALLAIENAYTNILNHVFPQDGGVTEDLVLDLRRDAEKTAKIFRMCLRTALVTGEMGQQNMFVLHSVLNSLHERLRPEGVYVEIPLEYQIGESICNVSGELIYDVGTATSGSILPSDRELVRRLTDIKQAREEYLQTLASGTPGFRNFTNHMVNLRREIAIPGLLSERLSDAIFYEFGTRVIPEDQRISYDTLYPSQGYLAGDHRSYNLAFSERSRLRWNASKPRLLGVTPVNRRQVLVSGSQEDVIDLYANWSRNSVEGQTIKFGTMDVSQNNCPILIDSMSLLGQGNFASINVYVDPYCREPKSSQLPYHNHLMEFLDSCDAEPCEIPMPGTSSRDQFLYLEGLVETEVEVNVH